MDFIIDYLVENKKRFPNKPAIIFEGKTFLWREVATMVVEYANVLKNHILKKQKVVCLFLPNCPEFIFLHLAILYTHNISFPMDFQFKKMEIKNVVGRVKPSLIITTQEFKKYFNKSKVLTLEKINRSIKINSESYKKIASLKGNPQKTIATLLFTSGVSGTPKLVSYSHFAHLWNSKTLSSMYQWTDKDSLSLSAPLSHFHGLVFGLNTAIFNGSTIYLYQKADVAEIAKDIEQGQISIFTNIPSFYQKLLWESEVKDFDLSKVRIFLSGASSLPTKLWGDFLNKYGVKIIERYGISETGIITSNSLTDITPGSVGKPLPGVKVKIIKGEITVKTPAIFSGYYLNGLLIKKQFTKDGYFKTGDFGVFDKDKHLYIKGRLIEKIKKSGFTIWAKDIEYILLNSGLINEACVIRILKPVSDKIIYFVVPKGKQQGKSQENDVIKFCENNMPSYWLPNKIIFLKHIPKTNSGKPNIGKLEKNVLKYFKQSIK